MKVRCLFLLMVLSILVASGQRRVSQRRNNRNRNRNRNTASEREYRLWDASYGNLICFSCSLDFRFHPFDSKNLCLGIYEPLNKTNLVRCGANEIYCKEDFLTGNGILWTVHRQCTAICHGGCRPRGFGITHTACTSCCTEHGCNNNPPSGLNGLGTTRKQPQN